jgi:hypothetical protein
MTKKADSPAPEDGLAALAAEGVDATTLAAGSVPVERLQQLLAADSSTRAALVQLLGSVPRDEHARLLVGMGDQTHGTVRREVRRALYRLRQAGIEPPAPAADTHPAARPPATADAEAWISYIDGRGDQLVWITKQAPGALLLIIGRVNDREGLCELSAAETSKRQFRLQRDELSGRHGLRMVQVDWRYADALLSAANARGAPKGSPGYSTARSRLTTDPPASLEPPIYRHIARDAVEAELSAMSGELLEARELQSWLPAPASLQPYVEELLDARSSPLVLSQQQQDDRMMQIVNRAANELYEAERWAPRLETMAFYFWATERERYARIALAAARSLVEGAQPQAVPVLLQLLHRAMSAIYEAARAEAETKEQESVLIKPGAPTRGSGR